MQFETPFGPAWVSIDGNGAVTAFGFGAGEGPIRLPALTTNAARLFS